LKWFLSHLSKNGASVQKKLCIFLESLLEATLFSKQNSNPFSRKVYIGNFVRSLQERTQQQLERHCDGNEDTDAFDYRRAMAAQTNYEWEDAFIAPVYGFTDYYDYYRQTSSIRQVPVLRRRSDLGLDCEF
jgi:predicted alpha/beta-fold hydrolase